MMPTTKNVTTKKYKRRSKQVNISMEPAFFEALLREASRQRRTKAATAKYLVEEALIKSYPELKNHVKV